MLLVFGLQSWSMLFLIVLIVFHRLGQVLNAIGLSALFLCHYSRKLAVEEKACSQYIGDMNFLHPL